MKKNYKKTLLFFISLFLLLSLAGCSKFTQCDVCQKEKICYLYELQMYGLTEEHYLCDDCFDIAAQGAENIGGTIKKIK